jgi:hypothetical protein
MKMADYDDMKRALAKLLAYTTIEQPGRQEITWNTWWIVDCAFRRLTNHVGSMRSPQSRFNRQLTSIVELADMFLGDDDNSAKQEAEGQ